MLNASNLSKNYKTSDLSDSFKALNNVNIHIEEGAFIGIMGPSGSGKTTEFKIILISPFIVGAFLGYIYTMINSLNTPVFIYFAKDLIIFIILFLLIEWIIYLISFKNYYKALSNV